MRQDLTEIVLVVDRSSSMTPNRDAFIEALNTFITDQKALPGAATLTLVYFNHVVVVHKERVSLDAVPLFDRSRYVTGGNTALNDAIGMTIDRVGEQLAALPPAARPGKVIVAVLTDGEENSSALYSYEQVRDQIKHQSEVYGWEFFFLASELRAIEYAINQLNIDKANTISYTNDAIGTQTVVASTLNSRIAEVRNQ